jgi:hypothetical protein
MVRAEERESSADQNVAKSNANATAGRAPDPRTGKIDKGEKTIFFEPIRTMILPSASGSARFLDLSEGKAQKAIRSDRPVAYLRHDEDGWQLMVENIYNYPTSRDDGVHRWATTSAAQIAEPAGLAAVPFERTGFYALRRSDLPITVLIPQWDCCKWPRLIGGIVMRRRLSFR